MNYKVAMTIVITLLISSCASVNSKFDCPMKPGVRCESIDSVNAKINSGEIGHDDIVIKKSMTTYQPLYENKITFKKVPSLGFYQNRPLRHGETIEHIWIAPFEDDAGNYHLASDIYTVVKPGYWIDTSVKTKKIME